MKDVINVTKYAVPLTEVGMCGVISHMAKAKASELLSGFFKKAEESHGKRGVKGECLFFDVEEDTPGSYTDVLESALGTDVFYRAVRDGKVCTNDDKGEVFKPFVKYIITVKEVSGVCFASPGTYVLSEKMLEDFVFDFTSKTSIAAFLSSAEGSTNLSIEVC